MQKEPDQAVRTKGPRYTPVSKRQDKPDGVAWLIRNHPELSDGQIGKLIGTTRSTIQALRERTHWNIANIQPKDPVTLGLTSQRELDAAVAKAAKAAGTDGTVRDTGIDKDREALIEELRAEREAARPRGGGRARRRGRRGRAPSRMPTTSSNAEPPTPDASLASEPYSHKGLTYPLGRDGPAYGEVIQLADGLGWTRSPVPGSLNHINLWLLDDGEGVALVDSGLDIPPAREAWEQAVRRAACRADGHAG